MTEAGWAALGALTVAAINMVQAVLMAWIRAAYPNQGINTNGAEVHIKPRENHNGRSTA